MDMNLDVKINRTISSFRSPSRISYAENRRKRQQKSQLKILLILKFSAAANKQITMVRFDKISSSDKFSLISLSRT